MTEATIRSRLRTLYEGAGPTGDRFRYALLAFDLMTVTWLIVSSFLPRGLHSTTIDIVIGAIFLVDLLARLLIARRPLKDLFSFWGIADLLVILSLLLPIWGEGLAFSASSGFTGCSTRPRRLISCATTSPASAGMKPRSAPR